MRTHDTQNFKFKNIKFILIYVLIEVGKKLDGRDGHIRTYEPKILICLTLKY